ncbi:hypothetical protein B0O99DRAFT_636012 [Bisporella sp. PMI_857]|nr:hypothetical protein B0O99DRAFT_636012 [Bisporella sp. PMI_857]
MIGNDCRTSTQLLPHWLCFYSTCDFFSNLSNSCSGNLKLHRVVLFGHVLLLEPVIFLFGFLVCLIYRIQLCPRCSAHELMSGDFFDVCYCLSICVTLHLSCLYAKLGVASANLEVAECFGFGLSFSESLSFCDCIVGNGHTSSGDQVGEEKCCCGNELERKLHGC